MTLDQILAIIGGKLISRQADLTADVSMACGADLMSDVLAFTREGAILLTGLTNPQVIRTAEMAGVLAIVFVRGKVPPIETVQLGEQKGIPLLATRCTMYEACGRLYGAGLPSCGLFDLASDAWADTFQDA